MYALEPHLPTIWLFIIAFFLLYYAIADGSDLGIGILSLFAKDEEERTLMMASMESIWHDNETWLVLLGGMLFGAFPLFYGLVLSSLYIPILAMVFGLVFRGVAIEFRGMSTNKRFWSFAFGMGSLITAIFQGFALGALVGGLHIENGQFAGTVWSWFSPFSLLVSAGVVCGYSMLGANYLILKTEGPLQDKSYFHSLLASCLTLMVSVAVHGWSTLKQPHLLKKWSQIPESLYMGLFLLLAAFSFIMYFYSLHKRAEREPLLWNMGIIVSSFTALSIGLYPQMIPPLMDSAPVTVHAAAASPKTLMFMLVVTSIMLPIILTYTSYKYRVFKGKVTAGTHGGYADERYGQ